MRTDEIIKALLEYVKIVPSLDGVAILTQAADLIESLSAQLATLQAAYDKAVEERDTFKAAAMNWHESGDE